jgi:arylsulfatase A-like enzyme
MSERKPNIVFILNDHQAYYRHGWDGGVKPARPNFDRLAREGVNFERAYAVCPLCTPTRRSMITGLFPHNHGFLTLDESENSTVRDKGVLFPLLAEQGYRNYYYGKWHTGPGTPQDYGCEGFSLPGFGNPYTTPEYKAYTKARGMDVATFNIEHIFMEPVSPDEPQPGPGYRCDAHSLHPHITGVMETPPETHESFFIANLVCDRLRELAESKDQQPFFFHIDFFGPHAPYLASPEYVAMYNPQDIREYGSFGDDLSDRPVVYVKEMNEPVGKDGRLVFPNPLPWDEWQKILFYVYAQITQVDAAGGLILDELERLGFAENTLVIWTTDHGDPIATHGGHFGKEAFLSEEVLRIPLTMRWPGRIAPGEVSQQLVSNADLPVTILEAAGTSFNGKVDGRSLLDIVLQERAATVKEPWREDLMCQTHGHHNERVVGRALISGRYKYAVYKFSEIPEYVLPEDSSRPMSELYDLQEDPYQLKNLVSDPAYRHIVGDHQKRLKLWQKQTKDPISFPGMKP